MARKLQKKSPAKIQKVIKKAKEVNVSNRPQSANAPAMTVAMPTGEFVEAVGRRKTATARVRLYKTAGDFIVNQKAAGQYFSGIALSAALYNRPFQITDTQGNHAVSAVVTGSGIQSQMDALIHGISRALVKMDEAHRVPLKQQGLLTRDDRMRETRKVGTGGKARRKRQSPKR